MINKGLFIILTVLLVSVFLLISCQSAPTQTATKPSATTPAPTSPTTTKPAVTTSPTAQPKWWEKFGTYPARQLVEAVMPTTIPLVDAGVATPLVSQGLTTLIPEGAAQALPSYPWRKLVEAAHGKTPVGISAKEPPSSRYLRALLGQYGISLYPADLSYVTGTIKKVIKK